MIRADTADPGEMSPERRRRSDAEQNRARIIASARRIYREVGPDAPVDAIATDAGVGNATLYRHFPRPAELRDAALSARVAEVEGYLGEVEAIADPWVALERYIRHLAETPDNTFVDVLVTRPDEVAAIAADRDRIRPRVAALIAAAADAGLVRADYDVDDMNVFLFAHVKASSSSHIDAAASERLLVDYLNGIHSSIPAVAGPD